MLKIILFLIFIFNILFIESKYLLSNNIDYIDDCLSKLDKSRCKYAYETLQRLYFDYKVFKGTDAIASINLRNDDNILLFKIFHEQTIRCDDYYSQNIERNSDILFINMRNNSRIITYQENQQDINIIRNLIYYSKQRKYDKIKYGIKYIF